MGYDITAYSRSPCSPCPPHSVAAVVVRDCSVSLAITVHSQPQISQNTKREESELNAHGRLYHYNTCVCRLEYAAYPAHFQFLVHPWILALVFRLPLHRPHLH
jgi:hypothetical protein